MTISGSAGKAQFSGGRYSGTLDNYILQVFRQLTGGAAQLAIPPPQRTTINGMPGGVHHRPRQHRSGVVDVSVVAYQWDPKHVYHFVMLTPGGAGIGPFAPMVNSLRRITPAEAAAIRPRIIHVVTVAAGRHRPVARQPHGLSRFPARPVPDDERASREQPAGARAEGQAGRLRQHGAADRQRLAYM